MLSIILNILFSLTGITILFYSLYLSYIVILSLYFRILTIYTLPPDSHTPPRFNCPPPLHTTIQTLIHCSTHYSYHTTTQTFSTPKTLAPNTIQQPHTTHVHFNSINTDTLHYISIPKHCSAQHTHHTTMHTLTHTYMHSHTPFYSTLHICQSPSPLTPSPPLTTISYHPYPISHLYEFPHNTVFTLKSTKGLNTNNTHTQLSLTNIHYTATDTHYIPTQCITSPEKEHINY